MNVNCLPEPRLLFGNNRRAIDPRWGMLAYGPSGLDVEAGARRVIRAGAIGTHHAVSQLRTFIERLHGQIAAASPASEEKFWKVPFPGLGTDGPLGFDLQLDRNLIEWIDAAEEDKALTSGDRQERALAAFDLYTQKMQDMRSTWDVKPDIVFLPLSERLIEKCKDPRYEIERILYERKTMERRGKKEVAPFYDFHNALKLVAFQNEMTCQLVRPATMTFKGAQQDPATIAWNFAAASYYKATGSPWKLAEIDDRTCLVGLSFYPEIGEEETNMRTSMAHVYVKNAESQIIRGKPFYWDDPRPNREPHVDADHAEGLLREVIALFQRQRGKLNRVVVHKSSPYTQDEIDGLDRALPAGVIADYIHVEKKPGPRFFHKGEGFPPVRGSLIGRPRETNYLYTVGFVPALRTYMGSTVPDPIGLNAARLDSDMDTVARDVLALTKLDWNSTDFSVREPVTIAVSRKVGDVLAEPLARSAGYPESYRAFM